MQSYLWDWVQLKPRHVCEVGEGMFEVTVTSSTQMETLLRINGVLIHEDGRRARIELPPQNWDLAELADFIAEKLETQSLREVERNVRFANEEPEWVTQEQALSAERRPRPKRRADSRPPAPAVQSAECRVPALHA